MTHTLNIGDRNVLALRVDSNTHEIDFILHDEHFESITTLATLAKGGRWIYTTPHTFNRLMNIAKHNKKVRTLIRKVSCQKDEVAKSSLNLTWSCFKRRFNIRIHKIKHAIHL